MAIVFDEKIDPEIRRKIRKLIDNSDIDSEKLTSDKGYDTKGYDIEIEFSPKYTQKEIDNELYDLNCEAPNVLAYYSSGKINIEFEHDAIDMDFDPEYCSDCIIKGKCPRYQWN